MRHAVEPPPAREMTQPIPQISKLLDVATAQVLFEAKHPQITPLPSVSNASNLSPNARADLVLGYSLTMIEKECIPLRQSITDLEVYSCFDFNFMRILSSVSLTLCVFLSCILDY